MNGQRPISIVTKADLLAHTLALELESLECYRTLADSMESHNNRPAAALFEELTRSAQARAVVLRQGVGADALPELAPWEHHCANTGGVANCMSKAHFQMTAGQALELAVRNERRIHGCLLQMAGEIQVPELSRRAEEIAEEQGRRVELLSRQLAREAADHKSPPEDLDPPNVPE